MRGWTTNDHYMQHNTKSWRVTRSSVRNPGEVAKVYRAWFRGSGGWKPLPGTFNSAAEAVQQLENK